MIRKSLLVVALLFASGCADVGNSEKPSTYDAIVVADEHEPRGEARAEGTLIKIGGCVGLRSGSVDLLLIWPHATTYTSQAISLPSGRNLRLGDTVEFVGGFASNPSRLPYVPDIRLFAVESVCAGAAVS